MLPESNMYLKPALRYGYSAQINRYLDLVQKCSGIKWIFWSHQHDSEALDNAIISDFSPIYMVLIDAGLRP